MTQETYLVARKRHQAALATLGWKLSGDLKVPYATSPQGDMRIWFRPQAAWSSYSPPRCAAHSLAGARSLHADIRGLSTTELIAT